MSIIKNIILALSEHDDSADYVLDKKGNKLPDSNLRDSEKIPLKQDIEEYRPESNAGERTNPLSVSGNPEYRLVIEILDPIAVAKSESVLALFASEIVPGIVTREVYNQVRSEVILAMKERGIETDIRVITQ